MSHTMTSKMRNEIWSDLLKVTAEALDSLVKGGVIQSVVEGSDVPNTQVLRAFERLYPMLVDDPEKCLRQEMLLADEYLNIIEVFLKVAYGGLPLAFENRPLGLIVVLARTWTVTARLYHTYGVKVLQNPWGTHNNTYKILYNKENDNA